MNPDGTISYHLPTLQHQLAGLAPQAIAQRVAALLDEEIRHVANIEAARRLFARLRAQTPGTRHLSFEQWRDAWYGDIWRNHFTEAMRAKVQEAYGETFPKKDWQRAMEGLRMLDQLRATGSITESVLRALHAVLDALREFLHLVSAGSKAAIQQELDGIAAVLQEFGYEHHGVHPGRAQSQVAQPSLPQNSTGKHAVGTASGQIQSTVDGLASAPVPPSVRVGASLDSVKKHLPKDPSAPAFTDLNGTDEEVISRIEAMLKATPVVVDPFGRTILIASPEHGSLNARARHLAGCRENEHGTAQRIFDNQKAQWASCIPETIRHAQVIARQRHEDLYFRRYPNGRLHLVIIDQHPGQLRQGTQYDAALVTQFAPKPDQRFGGAVITHVREEKLPAASISGAVQTLAPQADQLAQTVTLPNQTGLSHYNQRGLVGQTLFSAPMSGKTLREVDSHLPRESALAPLLNTNVNNTAIAQQSAAVVQSWPDVLKAVDGSIIQLLVTERGSVASRVFHFIRDGATNTIDKQKAAWLPRVAETLKKAQLRLVDDQQGTRVFIRKYQDGTNHAIVIRPDGSVDSQRPFTGSLTTQFPLLASGGRQAHMRIDWVRPENGEGLRQNAPSPTPPDSAVSGPRQKEFRAQDTIPTPTGQVQRPEGLASAPASTQIGLLKDHPAAFPDSAESLKADVLASAPRQFWSPAEKQVQDAAVEAIFSHCYGQASLSRHTPDHARSYVRLAQRSLERALGGSSAALPGRAGENASFHSAALADWARDQGLLIEKLPPQFQPGSELDVGQMEHHVWLDGNHARAVKLTKAGKFGLWPVAQGNGWDMRENAGTPARYLERLNNSNAVFGDDWVLHGIVPNRNGTIQILTSQPVYDGDVPGAIIDGRSVNERDFERERQLQQVRQALATQGFMPTSVSFSTFYRPADGMAMLDAHLYNMMWVDTPVGKGVMPFDVVAMHPQGRLKENLEASLIPATQTLEEGDDSLLSAPMAPQLSLNYASPGTAAAAHARRATAPPFAPSNTTQSNGILYSTTPSGAAAGIHDGLASAPMPGKTLHEVDSHLPRESAATPLLNTKTDNAAVARQAAAVVQSWPAAVKAADGSTIQLLVSERGSLASRVFHFIRDGDTNAIHKNKASWLPRVTETLENAQLRLVDDQEGTRVFIRRYQDGTNHAIVIRPDGSVDSQRSFTGSLTTQFPLLASGGRQAHMRIDWVRPENGEGLRQNAPSPTPPDSAVSGPRQKEFRAQDTTPIPTGQVQRPEGLASAPVRGQQAPASMPAPTAQPLLQPSPGLRKAAKIIANLNRAKAIRPLFKGEQAAYNAATALLSQAPVLASAPVNPDVANTPPDSYSDDHAHSRRQTPPTRRDSETSPGFIARHVLGADWRIDRQEPPVQALHGNRAAIAAEYQRLTSWSAEKGLIFDPSRLGPERDSRGEHRIYQPVLPSDAGRVFKVTYPGLSGLTRRALVLKDGGLRVMEDDALPSEYLGRWALHNEMLGDDAKFEGLLPSPHGPSIVISQRHIEGSHPARTPDLSLAGWQQSAGFWTHPHPADPSLLIGLADTKPSNWIEDSSNHVVFSIDTIPFIVTDAMRAAGIVIPGQPIPPILASAPLKAIAPHLSLNYVATDGQASPSTAAEDAKRAASNPLDQGASLRAGGAQRFPNASQSLLSWAKENGWLIDADTLSARLENEKEIVGGDEHHVWFDEATQRAVKLTIDEKFVQGSPAAYMINLRRQNELFATACAFEGIADDEGKPRIVTSQPWVDGTPAEQRLKDACFDGKGFSPISQDSYYSVSKGMLITDAKPANVLQRADGTVQPIDIQVKEVSPRQQEMYENRVAARQAGLMSAPAQPPGTAAAARAAQARKAIASMPKLWRDVLLASLSGQSIQQIAAARTAVNLPFATAIAVGNVLNQASGRLRVLLNKNAIKPTVQVQDAAVKAVGGRPERSLSGNAAVAAVAQHRLSPEEVTHAEMQELATRMFAVDPAAAEKLVTRWMDSGTTVLSTTGMPAGIQTIVDTAQVRMAAEMLMTAAAKKLVSEKALQGGNSTQLARLIDLYRNTGTEQARALNMRRHPFDTPEERAAMYLSETLLTPPPSIRAEMKKNPASKDKILAAWAAQADKIKADLLAAGIDLDATFREMAREQKLAEQTIPEPVKAPLARAPKKTRLLVKAVLEGRTWQEAIDAAGLTQSAAKAACNAFRATLHAIAAKAAAEARDPMRPFAPVNGDSAASLGLPEWTDELDLTRTTVKTAATEKLKAQRARKHPGGEIDLKNPISVWSAARGVLERKSTAFDKLSEYWRASILSGPQAQEGSIVSTRAFEACAASFKTLAAGAQADMARMFGLKPDAASLADIPAILSATLPAIKSAFLDCIRSWKSETGLFDAYAVQMLDDHGSLLKESDSPALKGTLGQIMRGISFRLMGAADEFMQSFHTRIAVAAQARQIARKEGKTGLELANAISGLMQPGSLAWERTLAQAAPITFQAQELRGYGKLESPLQPAHGAIDTMDHLADLSTHTKKGGFGRMLKGLSHFTFPFIDTPSCVGGLLTIIDAARSLHRRKQGGVGEAKRICNAARALDDITHQIVAWGFILGLSALVKPGDDEDQLPFITGTMPWPATSPGEREPACRTAPARSIRIAGTWYSYEHLHPFASALAFTIDAIRQLHSGRPVAEVWSAVGTGMLTHLQDKTFLLGISDLVNAVQDPQRFGTPWATHIALGFGPALLRQTARTSDDPFRETALPHDLGFFEVLSRRIGFGLHPAASHPLTPMPAVDIWGRPAARTTGTGTGGPNTDWLLRLFSPAKIRAAGGVDPLDVALLRYNMTHAQPFTLAAPSRELQNTIGKKVIKISLTDPEHLDFVTRSGHAARVALGSAFNGRDLTEDDIEQIKGTISKVHSAFRKAAFDRAVQARGGLNALIAAMSCR